MRDKHGAHNSYMLNLMRLEEDGYITDDKKHWKLLKEVKQYMIDATEYALSKNVLLTDEDRNILKTFLPEIKKAQVSDELLTVCKEGIELLLKYKPS